MRKSIIALCFLLSSCCKGVIMGRENLENGAHLIKFFCNKNKKQTGINMSSVDGLIGYRVWKNDCNKVEKVIIVKGKNRISFDLSERGDYNPFNHHDSIILFKLIHLTDSLG